MDSEAAEKPQKIAAFREVSRLEWSIYIISASVFIVLFLGILGLTQYHTADEAREHDLNDASEGAALVKILLEETPGTAPTAEVMKKIRDAGMTLEILQGNPPITEANPQLSDSRENVEVHTLITNPVGEVVSVARVIYPSQTAKIARYAVQIYSISTLLAGLLLISLILLILHHTVFRKINSLVDHLQGSVPEDKFARSGDPLHDLSLIVNSRLELLQQQADRNQSLLDAHEEIFCEITRDGSIKAGNTALAGLLGMQQEKLAGLNYADRVVPADRTELLEYLQHFTPGSSKLARPHRVLTIEGKLRWVQWREDPRSASPDPALRFYGLDVTDEQELAARILNMRTAFDQMQSLAGTGSLTWDLTTNLMHWTPEAARLLQVDDDDIAPELTTLLTAIDESERTKVRLLFERARDHGDSFEAQLQVPLPDGSVRHLHMRAEVMADLQTKLLDRLTCTLHDITSLRAAQTSMAGELRFRGALEKALSVGLVVRDMQGNTTSANPAFTKMVGYSEDELKASKPPMEPYWPEEEYENTKKALRSALLGQSPTQGFELVFCRKDGSHFDALVQVTTIPGEEGQPVAILGTVTDISEIQTSKRELLLAEAKAQRELSYRRTIEKSVTVGLIAVDSAGRPLSVNHAFCQMLGLTEAEALAMRPPYPYWPPDQLAEIEKAFALHLEGKTPPDGFSLRFQKKDGTPLDVLLRAAPLYDTDNKQFGVLSALTDITQLQQIRANLRLTNERLKLATDIAEVGTWEWEPESGELTWDRQTFSIYGHPDEKNPHTVWAKSVSPDEGERLTYGLKGLIAKGGLSGQQLVMVTWPDGTKHHILSTYLVVRNSDGKCLRVFGVNRDITQELDKERDLRNSNERLIAALEGADFGMFEHVMGVGNTNWTPNNYRINGIDPSITDPGELFKVWRESIGDQFSELMHNLNELPVSETYYSYELTVTPPGQEARRIRTNIFIERNDHGHPEHLVGISRRLD